jgi:hypothetical protein
MAGVVDARRNFVELHPSIRQLKELQPKTADASDGGHGCLGGAGHGGVGEGTAHEMTDVFAVDGLHDRIAKNDRATGNPAAARHQPAPVAGTGQQGMVSATA